MSRRPRLALTTFASAALLLGAIGCEVTTTPEQDVRDAVRDALPDMESFELVRIDDEPIVEELRARADAPSPETPLRFQLPIVSPGGELRPDFDWTAYHVPIRDPEVEGDAPVFGVPEDPEPRQVLTAPGPSLTFRGVPDLSAEAYQRLWIDAHEGAVEYDEARYQPSVLNVLGGELDGTYYGPEVAAPSVLQGLRSVLEPHHGETRTTELLSEIEQNYLVYSHANYQPPLEHIDQTPEGVEAAGGHDHVHDRETTDADTTASSDAATLEPQAHTQFRTVNIVPVADDTIYDPDTNTWEQSNWFGRMDAAVNRMDLFNVWVNAHRDVQDANDNRIHTRARIPEYRVLTETGKENLDDNPSGGCGGADSYRGEIRSLSNPYSNYDNEYWLWSTESDFNGAGCSYTQVVDLDPRHETSGGEPGDCSHIHNRNYAQCGAVGYIEIHSSSTQDWVSHLVMHETGHALNGRHDSDAFGSSGRSTNSHRCTLLGIWEIGATGPSLMSYASGTDTNCFAWADPDDTSADAVDKNVGFVADFLHGALQ